MSTTENKTRAEEIQAEEAARLAAAVARGWVGERTPDETAFYVHAILAGLVDDPRPDSPAGELVYLHSLLSKLAKYYDDLDPWTSVPLGEAAEAAEKLLNPELLAALDRTASAAADALNDATTPLG
jgi:hypothetical protein